MLVDVYNRKNEKVGTLELPNKVFGVRWNPELVHQVLMAQLANRRQKLAHTKGRAEVRGGGRKPWRQKGTGRARHGSIRSPLWKGGGVTHGPTKEIKFGKKINKKMKKAAVFSVLSQKLKEGELKVTDSLKVPELKTKNVAAFLKHFLATQKSWLLVPSTANKNIKLAASNLKQIGLLSPQSLNVYDLLKYKNILLEKDAAKEIEKHYLKS